MQAVSYQTEPPKVPRVIVIARDPDTGKSKSKTIYNTDPETFINGLRGDDASRTRRTTTARS